MNGKIYTVSDVQPWVEAVAIKDGKFFAVGSSDDVAAVTGDGTDVVHLAGASTRWQTSWPSSRRKLGAQRPL